MVKFRIFIVVGILFSPFYVHADEGMWLLSQLNKSTYKMMHEMGLELKYNQLYNASSPSLKDAIVSFGGFCSGVVVSSDGLVLTNHHCGLSCVQQHSSPAHNYLENGFIAHSLKEELPNPELFVRFLLYSKDVTKRVLHVVNPKMTEQQRNIAIDSVKNVISHEVSEKDSTLTGVVDNFYGGSEFNLSVYRDFTDIRLVFAPPASVGQFGWDTDNWVWPRHTGDFCVFRIYSDNRNKPADYSSSNVPYHPSYVTPISLNGYKEGSFCMTLGYPGATERYLSSFGIDEMVKNTHQAMIDVRGVKLKIWREAMNQDNNVRIKYASKYSECSNYWKNSIGMNKAVGQLKIIGKRRLLELKLQKWILSHKSERKNINLLADLESSYKERSEVNRAQSYFVESFFNGSELLQFAMQIMNFDFNAGDKQVKRGIEDLISQYKNYDVQLDKKVFKALLKEYKSAVDTTYLPEMYDSIAHHYSSVDAYIDSLYAQSEITSLRGLQRFLNRDSTYHIMKDPAIILGADLIVKYFEMGYSVSKPTNTIDKDERLLIAAIRRMYSDHHYYPDANSTMRLSYGSVCSYLPKDGIKYKYYTTAKGILEKAKIHQGDRDFRIKSDLVDLISNKDYGRYVDKDGRMNVCFISNNDITGGNSGSAMFNGKGELIGLAFDGNWEAMSSDLEYEPSLQRCIGVDIRYILFLIDKYGKDGNLIKELHLEQ